MSDRETLGVYDDQAKAYAERFGAWEVNRHLKAFIEGVAPRGRVLDLGCGPGFGAAAMAKAGLQVDAWDASPEMAKFGRETLELDIKVRTFDALDACAQYDGIYANFSLLHAPKPEMPDHLARVANALKPGGLFHIGTKTGTGEKRDHLGRFYAFYEDAELTGLLKDVGLNVTSRETGKDVGLAGTEDPWIIMQARKNA